MSAPVFSLIASRSSAERHRNAFRPAAVITPPPAVRQLSFEERRARNIADNFYPTPPEATRALLSVETFDGSIWEPACGEGHIAKVLERAGHRVVSTDLNDRGFGEAGVDFLQAPAALAKHIVTNPPYGSGLADAFIEKALAFCAGTGGTVAMLLNLNSLCHHTRTSWWRSHPPARIYAVDSVVCWSEPDRAPPRHFTQNRYYWAVWTPGHVGPSAFWWLSAADFREVLPLKPVVPPAVSFAWLRRMTS